MKRRDFVKNSLLASSGVFMVNSVLGCVNPSIASRNLDEIFKGFQNPPVTSRVFVRWWWNGNRLTKNEILRELDVMKAAGIGGVEINPIAFPQGADPAGYEALTIFTEEWLEMLEVALRGAKERGMICDMIVGSGWPFGGEFLKKEEQSQMVTIETVELKGGRTNKFNIDDLLQKVNPDIHSKNKTVYKDLLMARMLPKESDQFVEGEDLMGRINQSKLSIDVPKGKYVLYFVVKLTGYMAVINGAPGAAGPVLNHYNKEATEAYLNRISGFISGKMGNMGDYIRAMFCDSMELEGANWNDDLPEEFEKRRGYALTPYLPFVLKKVGHMGNPLEGYYGTKFSDKTKEELRRIELDLYITRIELFRERFIGTFNDWCHRNNVKSRMQAYGRGMQPVEASMEIDIPECESWMFDGVGTKHPNIGLHGRAPLMCNKFVSSGAALAGKNIVSCEEITNTSMVFMITLEEIKIAGDQTNISGVNHSVLHGFNYSPPEVEFPGWIRYGTFFNERNTWWSYFRKWSDYKARISYLLQNATPQANVAILQPLTDLWLKYGPQRDPFPQKRYPDYQFNLWEAVHQNGSGCDYVSEKIINDSTFEGGNMIYKNRSYSSLLLPDIETLDLATAQSLVSFVKSGGKIVFIGKTPFKSPAYKNADFRDKKVGDIVADLIKNENVILYPAPEGEVIEWYGKLQQKTGIAPYVRFNKTHNFLNQSSYKVGKSSVYFIANSSMLEDISVEAEFQVDDNYYPCIWNPETGERKLFQKKGGQNKLDLKIPRSTSVLIVFEENSNAEQLQLINPNKQEKEISGVWQLKLNHLNGTTQTIELKSLSDLSKNKKTRNFAGEAIYEKIVRMDSDKFRYLDLGMVRGVSELSINGKQIGTKWYGQHIYDLGEVLKKGENKLSVKLTTITGNYLKGQTENQVAMQWTRRQEYSPMGILGPVILK